jgi:hypothetical protein
MHSMRTTLSIDDDVLKQVKKYAESRSLALGEAVTDLVRRALTVPCPTREVNGVQVFDLPAESPRVTGKKVRELDAEQR